MSTWYPCNSEEKACELQTNIEVKYLVFLTAKHTFSCHVQMNTFKVRCIQSFQMREMTRYYYFIEKCKKGKQLSFLRQIVDI